MRWRAKQQQATVMGTAHLRLKTSPTALIVSGFGISCPSNPCWFALAWAPAFGLRLGSPIFNKYQFLSSSALLSSSAPQPHDSHYTTSLGPQRAPRSMDKTGQIAPVFSSE
mmetsp:Transcript_28405/g.44318  ORF Transcript_28405/g.44318 Transcript_28405/m.44318 type:complete len:111 (-) Transcript_28405:190-522(-)